MSAVGFKSIPSNLRLPLFFAELDNSQANSAAQQQRTLIIGQITSAGAAVPNVPILSQGVGDAAIQGGPGSMLHLMTQAYRGADPEGEVWYLPLADATGATAAAGTITITTVPTSNGTLYLYIGGVRIAQPVLPTQTPAAIAAALAATITATPNLPVTATVNAAVVTLTAINLGPGGNEIDLRLNYGGTRAGETMPPGMQVTVAPMTGGQTPPTLTTGLLNLANMPFDFIVMPYVDSVSVAAIATLLSDQTGRWSWDQQIYGHAFGTYRGTVGACTTYGVGNNNQHVAVLGFNDMPNPAWILAAQLTGAAAVSLRADPALPLQGVAIPGAMPPPVQSRFQMVDRNALLYDGISTFTVGSDGTCYIENLITTYQKNAFGQPDNSYLEVETMFTLMYVLRFMNTRITSKFGRVKLAADGTRIQPGSGIVTPSIIKAELIAAYNELQDAGLVQNAKAFAQQVIVQKNAQNPNRVDVLWPGTLINQLRQFAMLAQFRLQ